jgi:hypothetical protein
VVALAVAGTQIAADPRGSVIGLGLLLLGLPVYLVWSRQNSAQDTSDLHGHP